MWKLVLYFLLSWSLHSPIACVPRLSSSPSPPPHWSMLTNIEKFNFKQMDLASTTKFLPGKRDGPYGIESGEAGPGRRQGTLVHRPRCGERLLQSQQERHRLPSRWLFCTDYICVLCTVYLYIYTYCSRHRNQPQAGFLCVHLPIYLHSRRIWLTLPLSYTVLQKSICRRSVSRLTWRIICLVAHLSLKYHNNWRSISYLKSIICFRSMACSTVASSVFDAAAFSEANIAVLEASSVFCRSIICLRGGASDVL
jgi:hypothetical protein